MQNQVPVERATIRAHKRQFVWQILVPMIVVVLIGLGAGGLVIAATVSGLGQTRVWADVSAIWLIAPALLFALAVLVVLVAVIYGMIKLLQILPTYTGKTQNIFALLSAWTRKVADAITQPFVWTRQAAAAIKSIFKL